MFNINDAPARRAWAIEQVIKSGRAGAGAGPGGSTEILEPIDQVVADAAALERFVLSGAAASFDPDAVVRAIAKAVDDIVPGRRRVTANKASSNRWRGKAGLSDLEAAVDGSQALGDKGQDVGTVTAPLHGHAFSFSPSDGDSHVPGQALPGESDVVVHDNPSVGCVAAPTVGPGASSVTDGGVG
jgi:hypothetical protein